MCRMTALAVAASTSCLCQDFHFFVRQVKSTLSPRSRTIYHAAMLSADSGVHSGQVEGLARQQNRLCSSRPTSKVAVHRCMSAHMATSALRQQLSRVLLRLLLHPC